MQLVCGNTMKGVYSLGTIDSYIDVTGIPELTEVGQSGNYSVIVHIFAISNFAKCHASLSFFVCVITVQHNKIGNPFIIGGNLPITDCIRELESKASETGYEYCAQVAAHLKMVTFNILKRV